MTAAFAPLKSPSGKKKSAFKRKILWNHEELLFAANSLDTISGLLVRVQRTVLQNFEGGFFFCSPSWQHDGKLLSEGTLAAVTSAASLGPVTVLVGGEGSKAVADSAASVAGVSSVSYTEGAAFTKGVCEDWAPLVVAAQAAGGHTHVVAAASAFSKGLFPRVAAMLDVAQLSDVLEVNNIIQHQVKQTGPFDRVTVIIDLMDKPCTRYLDVSAACTDWTAAGCYRDVAFSAAAWRGDGGAEFAPAA